MHSNQAHSVCRQADPQAWIENARDPKCFIGTDGTEVIVRETHISWVFLVGRFAFKVKKAIQTPFLDYRSLDSRMQMCKEELRLDRRYAPNLYCDVVSVRQTPDGIVIGDSPESEGTIVDYAVRMHRFDDDAILSSRLRAGEITRADICHFAQELARLHESSARQSVASSDAEPSPSSPIRANTAIEDAMENFDELRQLVPDQLPTLQRLIVWTQSFYENHSLLFDGRVRAAFIRECHGDLHLGNIVDYDGELVPFDGIEFNDRFRWIDVISDMAFAAMDFAAHGREDFCFTLINEYLDQAGDHAAIPLVRWYLVYRALVRAKVAAIRLQQFDSDSDQVLQIRQECERYISLAESFSYRRPPQVTIMFGVSGSGKTFASAQLLEQQHAIRLRSDVIRKRHFGLKNTQRPTVEQQHDMYSNAATAEIYDRLLRLTRLVLNAGFPVIVDAAFLKREQRETFRRFTEEHHAHFAIAPCYADVTTLRHRVGKRIMRNDDASDADLTILDHQLYTTDELSATEKQSVITADCLTA
ncbi:AAA family ATPase [Rhodopirellula sp. MGV]|uniref:bifunctional aminoglycoside phosphotransferase/ATP-binding protein n=1 Tax=Rhodopirellula sp. MGV TaxID=2023130 RepID=UPI000B9613A3|nr:bifunctional aminoglycoside phosphotransferase/ATP-binding protein [Rhodopirellula sp. MGV]OYP28220.1 hypothetical protein CGZ80_27410 [Rhodopirellula sp. MGV]PNY34385.1 hypothetical protein C2E31_23310 [Rhodopirellula baltica]